MHGPGVIRVYLDTDVLSKLGDGRIPQPERDLLVSAVQERHAEVLLSPENILEIAALNQSRPDLARQIVEFALGLSGGRFGRGGIRLVIGEALAALGKRKVPSLYCDPGSSAEAGLHNACHAIRSGRSDHLAEIHDIARSRTRTSESFRQGMSRVKHESDRIFEAAIGRRRRAGERRARFTLEEWRAHHYARGSLAEIALALPLESAGEKRHWKKLLRRVHRFPTLRMALEIAISYTYALVVHDTSTKRSFGTDQFHGLYAARVDRFISDDGQFREILKTIPCDLRAEVLSWAEYAPRLRQQQM